MNADADGSNLTPENPVNQQQKERHRPTAALHEHISSKNHSKTPQSEHLSPYEILRAKNIERNQNRLASLGLISQIDAHKVIDAAWKKNPPPESPAGLTKQRKRSARKRNFGQVQRNSHSNVSLRLNVSGKSMTRSGSRSVEREDKGKKYRLGKDSIDLWSSPSLSDLEGTWV
mmetsp:Transcript_17556/g.25627  ORF Transcript_17556/g.25627 Transcript_17556/m.25627 type:complete len:173 (+) Transcript_17556:96-614(+)|eukprot:CAMPEP_0197232676 /NCGR_PEP_ID=MMETSP1429-20130617/918_1 /TAXON_ID=49237 /ORGANISM="Chaetoceros  sp., Strain UNC1202" /LENGTH=172 /DNA_ID=CAMNT_0042690771 /DNA_START=129 /DNA_END=647 /DNA_ORIENTATION=+